MSDDTAEHKANGSHEPGPGELIVNTAVAALLALDDSVTSDTLDAILQAAVEAGASVTERVLIWKQAGEHLTGIGFDADWFKRCWSQIERDFNRQQREEEQAERAERREREAADEPTFRLRTPAEKTARAAELLPRVVSLLQSKTLLDDMVGVMQALGVVDASRHLKAVYLSYTSRLAYRPVSVNLLGAPASGKSYLADQLLILLFPETAYHIVQSGSPKAFIYWPENYFVHRIVYVGEAGALTAGTKRSDTQEFVADFMRQMQSDRRYIYNYVETKSADDPDRKPVSKPMLIAGPVCIVSTSTKALQDENATRTLTLQSDESVNHTNAILIAIADTNFTASAEAKAVDLTTWHEMQDYLSCIQLRAVIPYAHSLIALTNKSQLRIRRDFSMVLTLIEAHAVLNHMHRKHTKSGRVIATLADYAAVHAIFAADFDRNQELRPDDKLLDLCRLIQRLGTQRRTTTGGRLKPPAAGTARPVAISTREVATKLGVTHWAARQRIARALEDGLLEDLRTDHRNATQVHRLRVSKGALDSASLLNKSLSFPEPAALVAQWRQDKRRTSQPGGEGCRTAAQ
jgi:hypothetical protein